MTEATNRGGTRTGERPQEDRGALLRGRRGTDVPAAMRGRTSIADGVVAKIAGMAARSVDGVYDLGGGMARAFGAVRERVPGGGGGVTRGVSVEVGEHQAAVDLQIVVEYGVPIVDISADIRGEVINAVEQMTGLQVVEVNLDVNDVHLPGEESETAERVE